MDIHPEIVALVGEIDFDPEALHDDVLESCLYLLREKLRSGIAPAPDESCSGA